MDQWHCNLLNESSRPRPFLVLGAGGSGRWMNVGFYILYQLLHWRAEKPGLVVYCLGRELACVFGKEEKKVTEHEGEFKIRRRLREPSCYWGIGFVIYDASEEGEPQRR
ncbi:uncharacterized protein Tco025E_08918 [Trypanosoma conorhini]|uniref:Retrotransposon hot spot protein,C-terminal domain-containing protein n=1 Tax=Trypanosoma conorhini TaxID=83891 RepID=A0A422N3G7_9TRYP|nr:uncharacterized protein Tco025E_08918 [Trypanosoma conorhini]RNF00029.1 hypothetical protein Tco025E_08918 [Trypanosoma conorhini]